MTIFDIALDHMRERERLPNSYAVSARDLEIAAMIGQSKNREQADQALGLLQPLYTEPVDLDAIDEAYAVAAEGDDGVIFAE